MNYPEKAKALLTCLKDNACEASNLREAGTLYWNVLEESLQKCIREKADLPTFLQKEHRSINLGIAPLVIDDCENVSTQITLQQEANRYLKITFVSDWLLDAYSKIVAGDRREALEKEIKLTKLLLKKLEDDLKNTQLQRKDIFILEQAKGCGSNHNVDILDRADELRQNSLKIKKMSARGIFIPVAEKRKNFEMEQEYRTLCDSIAKMAASLGPGESATAMKQCTAMIEEYIVKKLDAEESLVRMNDELGKVTKKQQSVSVVEIEAALRKEIDYIKELTRLSAKRLRMESCNFLRNQDKFFTLKEINNCINRIIEFDPELFHNSRFSVFGLPNILVFPCNGNALYDWKNNQIIVPLIPPSGNFMASLASGFIEYRMDVDEDKRLLLSYNKLPRHSGVKSVFHLKGELTKDYISWMSSEYQGYKILAKEERKWFESEIGPNKNDIGISLEYRPFILAGEAFSDKCKEIETLLAGGADTANSSALWAAGILFYQQGKFEAAMQALKSYIIKDPDRPMAYYNLGIICEKLMRKQEAADAFGEYCKRNPQSWWASCAMDHIRRLQTGHIA
jgi:hypothetical protein